MWDSDVTNYSRSTGVISRSSVTPNRALGVARFSGTMSRKRHQAPTAVPETPSVTEGPTSSAGRTCVRTGGNVRPASISSIEPAERTANDQRDTFRRYRPAPGRHSNGRSLRSLTPARLTRASGRSIRDLTRSAGQLLHAPGSRRAAVRRNQAGEQESRLAGGAAGRDGGAWVRRRSVRGC